MKVPVILLLLWVAPAIVLLFCALVVFTWDRIRRDRAAGLEDAERKGSGGRSSKSVRDDRKAA